MTDIRDEFLGRVVAGKTFADVGGLWGTVNERVSVAHRLGASELTMVDITVPESELWRAFESRMRELGIDGCRARSADVCHVEDLAFDVVHCSGVLYHHPDPLVVLRALRRLTREHLVLTSAVTQEVVEHPQGTFRIPPSGVLFVPALDDRERQVLAGHWRAVGAEIKGITIPTTFVVENFGAWWWLPTASALVAMARVSGFDVLDQSPSWGGNAHTLLLAPTGADVARP